MRNQSQAMVKPGKPSRVKYHWVSSQLIHGELMNVVLVYGGLSVPYSSATQAEDRSYGAGLFFLTHVNS